jgi:glucose-fructose oxidoreductase
VVGLGDIAQRAILPAFQRARARARLVALVSGDALKLKKLGRQYGVKTYTTDRYDDCLASEEVDAVYIAVPNHLHAEYTLRAARAGVHVLCEKPLATSERECISMIQAAADSGVKLMTAYRLHFEPADLRALELARSGKLGELRFFSSIFSFQVADDNIRTRGDEGGSPAWDAGIYCVNAARCLFGEEPMEVEAASASGDDRRFTEIAESVAVTLRFPEERLAQFICSFGAAHVSSYRLVGTRGELRVEPAFEWDIEQHHFLRLNGKTQEKHFPRHDQFAAELIRFSEAIQKDTDVQPSGWEGLADVRVLAAIERSARSGRVIPLGAFEAPRRPDPTRALALRPAHIPRTVHTSPPVAPGP